VTLENYLAQLGAWVTVVQGAIFVVCVLTFRRASSASSATASRNRSRRSGGPMAYTDILYQKSNGVAWITINRPEVRTRSARSRWRS